MRTAIFALAFYGAALVLLGGLGYRIWRYATTPAPLKIPTTPAPLTHGGVALRMAGEVVLFQSLFKSNKWIWLFGWVFHVALAVVLLRHLRYFIDPVPDVRRVSFSRSESSRASRWRRGSSRSGDGA